MDLSDAPANSPGHERADTVTRVSGFRTVAARVRVVLPPAGPMRRYAFVSLVDATGTGMFLTVSVLFFTRIFGLAAGSVALGLSLAGLAAMIGAVPLESLSDRFG